MAATQAEQQATAEHADRILVALDASPQSVAALRAAAELAALLEAELEGLFVEDINLLHLCGLPFGREVGSYTASVRQLNDRAMERNLRALAIAIREAMEREAAQLPVRWTFQVRRGAVVAELLAASQSAAMLSLGRAGRRRRRTLGSVAESVVRQCSRPVLILGEEGGLTRPLSVLYTGSEAADRALRLAIDLEVRNPGGLRVWVWDDPAAGLPAERLQAHANARLAEVGLQTVAAVIGERELPDLLDKRNKGTLILPGEHSALLSRWVGPTILVP
jgi:nucleotide-binding universal stress UspA family protein